LIGCFVRNSEFVFIDTRQNKTAHVAEAAVAMINGAIIFSHPDGHMLRIFSVIQSTQASSA